MQHGGAGLAALEQYRRNYGDVLVPHWFTTADGLLLGRWVDSRRVEYRRGALGQERVQQLEQLGMVWRLRRSADDPARRQREDTISKACFSASHTGRVSTTVSFPPRELAMATASPSDGGSFASVGRTPITASRPTESKRSAQSILASYRSWSNSSQCDMLISGAGGPRRRSGVSRP